MFNLRPFEPTDEEYKAIVAVFNAVSPENLTALDDFKHRQQTRDPKYLNERVVVEVDDRIVAVGSYGESEWTYEPGKYGIGIDVHPDYRRRGIGTALYDHIWEALSPRQPKPHLLTANTRQSKTEAVRFLEKRGFKPVMRWMISYLDVEAFDAAAFAAVKARVEDQGIKICTFTELEAVDSEARRTYYALDCAVSEDEPNTSPLTVPPFDVFEKQFFENPNFNPDAFFIALDGEVYVGMAEITPNKEKPSEFISGFGGVLRSHRRQPGIMSALKLHTINYAKAQGAKTIKTGNEENNPMLQINLNFGFETVDASVAFEKRV